MKKLSILLSAFLCIPLSGCMSAKGDGKTWSLLSLATDYSDLDLSGAGLKASNINQSVSYNATLAAARTAWSNYLMAEGMKWVTGKYYDHKGLVVKGEQAVELEQLRNAKSAAESAAALEQLKVTEAAAALTQ